MRNRTTLVLLLLVPVLAALAWWRAARARRWIRELAAPIVVRTALDHEDPASGTVLPPFEVDTREGRNVRALPDFAGTMLARLSHFEEFADDIEGVIAL